VAWPVRSCPMFAPMVIHQFYGAVWPGSFTTYRHHFRGGDVIWCESNRTGSIRDGVVVHQVLFIVELVLSLFRLPFVGDEFIVLILIMRFTLPLY
jgi:hypothetical protein